MQEDIVVREFEFPEGEHNYPGRIMANEEGLTFEYGWTEIVSWEEIDAARQKVHHLKEKI